MTTLWQSCKTYFSQLRAQIIAIVLLLVFFAIVIITYVSSGSMKSALLEQTEQSTLQILDQVIRNVDYYVSDMKKIASVVNKQPDVLSLLFNKKTTVHDLSSYFDDSQTVQRFLRDFSRLRPEITQIVIIGENGAYTSTRDNTVTIDKQATEKLSWYQNAKNAQKRPVFDPPHLQSYAIGAPSYVISLYQSVFILEQNEPLGAVKIDLNLDVIKDICSSVKLAQTGYIFIVDDAGNYVYHPDPAYVSRNNVSPSMDSILADDALLSQIESESSFIYEDRYVVSKRLSSANWYAVGVVPYSQIAAPALRLGNIQLAIGTIGAVCIAIVIALLLSRMIFKPLISLRKTMVRAQSGDFEVREGVIRDNEIGALAGGFNEMIDKIRSLMNNNIETEKAKRKAELDALQAQINPHFLYNTLDAIVWMSEYKPQIASSMADALAKLFRLMLGGGEPIVPLRQELEHVNQYLTIQKMRYATKFDYEMRCEPEIRSALVPKIIVQPLVENAIYHGIKVARRKCRLLVLAYADGDELVVQVVDDGVGMPQDVINTILTDSNVSEKPLGGIGVRNVNERLCLYYGNGYPINYYSVQTVGTIAEIRIPLR